jgi:hypothetical protein
MYDFIETNAPGKAAASPEEQKCGVTRDSR